jgi:hypothetical protein
MLKTVLLMLVILELLTSDIIQCPGVLFRTAFWRLCSVFILRQEPPDFGQVIHLPADGVRTPKPCVAYRPVAKRWLCKQQPLLWSARSLRCAVTSHNYRIGDAGGVLCGCAPRLYDSTDRVMFSEWVQCSWEFKCRVLTSGQRKL